MSTSASYTRVSTDAITAGTSLSLVIQGYTYSGVASDSVTSQTSLELIITGFSFARVSSGSPTEVTLVKPAVERILSGLQMVSVSSVGRIPFVGNAVILGASSPALVCMARGYKYACYSSDGSLVSSGDASSSPGANGGLVGLAGGYGLTACSISGTSVTVYGSSNGTSWSKVASYDLSTVASNNNISSIVFAVAGYDGSGYPLLAAGTDGTNYYLIACESSGTCHVSSALSSFETPDYAVSAYTSSYTVIASSNSLAVVYSGGAIFDTGYYFAPGCSGYYYAVDLVDRRVYVKSIDTSAGSATVVYTHDFSMLYTPEGLKSLLGGYGVLIEPMCVQGVAWGFILAGVVGPGVANAVYSDGSTVAVSALDYSGAWRLDPSIFDDAPVQVAVCSDGGNPGACPFYILPPIASELYVK